MSADEIGGYGITGHYGKGGSGKSRDIVETDIIPALQKGRHVYTNIPLLIDGIMTYYRGIDWKKIHVLTHEDLKEMIMRRKVRGKDDSGEMAHAMIVWDEIQDVLPSGFKSRRGEDGKAYEEFRDAFIEFLAWSRHDDCEFVWATQHYASVDVELRRKTHIFVQHESLFHLGLAKKWAARNQLPDSQTGDPLAGSGTERIFGENAVIFRCYKSAEVGNHKASSRQKMMIPKKVFIIFGLAIIAAGYSIWGFMTKPGIGDLGKKQMGVTQEKTEQIKDTIKAEGQTKTQTKQRGGTIESEICVYDVCYGINGGVIVGAWKTNITIETGEIQQLREGVLPGDIPRLQNGIGANMPGQ